MRGGCQRRRFITHDSFVLLIDLAPTFLEIARLQPWPEMTVHSFVDVLTGEPSAAQRDRMFIERERHANVRRGDLSYPDRWLAGDPELYYAVGTYGDIDGSRTKLYMMAHANDPAVKPLFVLSFGKRPAEKLYDVKHDPDQVVNLAADPRFAKVKTELSDSTDAWMRETADPRVDPATNVWDSYPYLGGKAKELRQTKQ